jgi:hypothetical protein
MTSHCSHQKPGEGGVWLCIERFSLNNAVMFPG